MTNNVLYGRAHKTAHEGQRLSSQVPWLQNHVRFLSDYAKRHGLDISNARLQELLSKSEGKPESFSSNLAVRRLYETLDPLVNEWPESMTKKSLESILKGTTRVLEDESENQALRENVASSVAMLLEDVQKSIASCRAHPDSRKAHQYQSMAAALASCQAILSEEVNHKVAFVASCQARMVLYGTKVTPETTAKRQQLIKDELDRLQVVLLATSRD